MAAPRPVAKPPNLLEASGLPLAYAIASDAEGIPSPPAREGHDVSARSLIRSLTVMQKEAVVATSGSPITWRLSSDEGPYLNGHDYAPAPLAVTTAGLAADLMNHIGQATSLRPAQLRLTLDMHFAIEGSMIRRTMVGSAQAPEITLAATGGEHSHLMDEVLTAVNASATAGLLAPHHESLFSLTSHGRRIETGTVPETDEEAPQIDVDSSTGSPPAATNNGQDLVVKTRDVEDKPPDAGVGYQETQRRSLHLRGQGGWRDDGVKSIEVEVIRPRGSIFRLLSDEPPGRGGEGRAPDALALISAGLGFCFMTQIGRFAKIAKHSLGDYYIVQDTRFSVGDATVEPPVGGRAAAPRTHVYLAPDGDDDFAREALAMSEQTCYLHALCRTELRPKVKVAIDPPS